MGTQLTREVKVTRWQLPLLVLETKTGFRLSRDLHTNKVKQFIPYFIDSEMPMFSHFYIFDIRLLLQLMIYCNLIGRVVFLIGTLFLSYLFIYLFI